MGAVDLCVKFVGLQAIQVHDISNIQVENPVIFAHKSEVVASLELVPLILLQLIEFPLTSERNVQFSAVLFGLINPVPLLEVIVALLGRFLTNLLKVS